MIHIQTLDHASQQPYLLLVKPGFRQMLFADGQEPTLVVLGASFWGQPIGLLLAEFGKTKAYLLDLYVLPDYRRGGVATQLLERLEEVVIQAGLAIMHTLHKEDKHRDAFHACLINHGWNQPTCNRTLFGVQTSLGIGEKRWVKSYRFRPPYDVINWTDVTRAERETIRQRGEEGWYPADLSPLIRPDGCWDPKLSVALRRDGEIVGWALSIRESPEQQMIETMFVDPPLQPLGRGMMLVGELIRRSIPDGIEYSYWGVAVDNEPMLHWTRRAFENTIFDEYDEYVSYKELST